MYILIAFAVILTTFALFAGLIAMARGQKKGKTNLSNKLMWARVAAQFCAILLVLIASFLQGS